MQKIVDTAECYVFSNLISKSFLFINILADLSHSNIYDEPNQKNVIYLETNYANFIFFFFSFMATHLSDDQVACIPTCQYSIYADMAYWASFEKPKSLLMKVPFSSKTLCVRFLYDFSSSL